VSEIVINNFSCVSVCNLYLIISLALTLTITVVDEILTANKADTATETFVSLLDDIFTNESYLDPVLKGEDSPTFEANLVKVTDSVGEIENAVASADNIGEDDKAEAQARLDRVKELLELLAGVVEGPQV
jgi:hypothetical protein